jgi:ribulose-5-phosphate 4-epimerase/fuculose-1-phosphate aldolase
MTEPIDLMRARIAELGHLMFDRFITDTAGGNISARVGDLVCITARHCGSKYQWRIRPEQVLITDLAGNKLDGDGDISREAKTHLKLLTDFPDGKAIVHCHPRHVMVFAMVGRPIPPVMEGTLKLGTIPVSKFAPAHGGHLAEQVAMAFEGAEEKVRKYAAAVIAPYHGLFVLSKDLETAFDAAERIEVNAQCILEWASALNQTGQSIDDLSKSVVDTITGFKE